MNRIIACFVGLILAATILLVLFRHRHAVSPQTAHQLSSIVPDDHHLVRPHTSHQLSYTVPIDDHLFTAQIDGRTFSSLDGLKDYLATYPAGDAVTARIELPGTGPKEYQSRLQKELLEYERYHQELTQFCSAHHIVYMYSTTSA